MLFYCPYNNKTLPPEEQHRCFDDYFQSADFDRFGNELKRFRSGVRIVGIANVTFNVSDLPMARR